MPTQRDIRLRVDERRCRRFRLLAAACSSTGSQRFDMASVSCLLLWQRRHKQRRPNAGGRGVRRRARVRTAQGDGDPPLVAEGEGDRPRRAEGDGEQPPRRATTTEVFGNRQARVRGEHRRELATIERGGVGPWRAKANTSAVGAKVTMVLVHCRSSMIMPVTASYPQPCG
jgi:hypothetical protein